MGTGGILTGDRLRITALSALTVLAALPLLAGCGSSGDGTTTTLSAAAAANEKSASTVVETEPVEGSAVSTGIPGAIGRVVVTQAGFTLYAFSKDKKGSGKTACYGRCERVWLPYLTPGKPTVVLKARASEVGTLKRKDGAVQVTYGGWPLYSHVRDGWPLSSGAHEPAGHSDAAGRKSFGGVWHPVDPSGELAE